MNLIPIFAIATAIVWVIASIVEILRMRKKNIENFISHANIFLDNDIYIASMKFGALYREGFKCLGLVETEFLERLKTKKEISGDFGSSESSDVRRDIIRELRNIAVERIR